MPPRSRAGDRLRVAQLAQQLAVFPHVVVVRGGRRGLAQSDRQPSLGTLQAAYRPAPGATGPLAGISAGRGPLRAGAQRLELALRAEFRIAQLVQPLDVVVG